MKQENVPAAKSRSAGAAKGGSGGTAKARPDRQAAAAASGGVSGRAFELRFAGDSTRLSAIFKALAGKKPRRQKTRCTYYDTADARLFGRGYALSLRPRDKAHELCLEALGGAPASAVDGSTKRSWRASLAAPIADIGRLPRNAPRRDIGVILPEELKARVVSRTQVESKEFDLDGGRAMVSLVTGNFKAGGREAPLAELRFGLLAGDKVALVKAVKAQLRRGGLVYAAGSEAARAMDLFVDRPPPWVKASRPALDGGDSLGQAMAKILTVTARQVTDNIAAAADGRDPEGVHQLRVALRRLRSAFTLFKGHLTPAGLSLAEGSKTALSALGPARDLDVFLAETLPPVLASDGEDTGLQRLARRAVARQGKAYTGVRRLLRGARFNTFLLDLLLAADADVAVIRDPDSPLRPVAAAHLQKRHKAVMKAGRHFATMPNMERHNVRIALKKLRYACDYFQPLFPGEASLAYLAHMEALQDDLGRLNDATVAEHLVDDLAGDDVAAACGGAMVKGWYRHRLHSIEPHMVDAWSAFAADPPFWRA